MIFKIQIIYERMIKKMEIKAVLEILPASIRKKLEETENMNNLQEIRIKIGKPIIFQIGLKKLFVIILLHMKI